MVYMYVHTYLRLVCGVLVVVEGHYRVSRKAQGTLTDMHT
jgi:hypothetical protein